MDPVLLATAAEDVRLWTMPDLKLHSVKNVTSGNVTYCTCSNNGQMVAYTHEVQGVSVAFLQNEEPTIAIPTSCEQSNAWFSTNSKYLVTGGNDCVVSLWDIKSRSLKRTYKDHTNPISFSIFNFNGNVVASASTQGEIILTEVQSGAPCQPMVGDNKQGITCLGYSHFTRYLLASTNNVGTLALWDTKESKLVKNFNEHSAIATSLSFSPLNDMLLCSVGLDKRMIFYDVCYKKIVKTITAEAPLTSCEFLHDGTTVAVGSVSGKVSVFDLRHGSLPLTVIPAHKTAVRSVSFQKVPKEKPLIKQQSEERISTSSSFSSTTSGYANAAKILPFKSPTEVNISRTSNENQQAKMDVKLKRASSYDVLGKTDQPRHLQVNRDKQDASAVISKSSPSLEEKRLLSTPVDQTLPTRKPMRREKSDLIKHEGSQNDPGTPLGPRRPSFERSRSGLSRFLLMTRSSEDVSFFSSKKKEKSSDELFRIKKHKDGEKEDVEKKSLLNIKSPFKKKGHDPGKRSDESETSSIDSVTIEDKTNNTIGRKHRISNRSNDSVGSTGSNRSKLEIASSPLITERMRNNSQSQPTIDESNSLQASSNEAPSPLINSADNTSQYDEVFEYEAPPNNISVEFIEKMISETMEDNRIAIHNDIVNLQVEFIRQMEIQKKQIQQMLEHYSVKDDLVREVLGLRAENSRLHTKY